MVQKSDYKFLQGDALSVLKGMPDKSVQCCVTSPPYYGLRDYGTGTWVGGDPNCPHYRKSKASEFTSTGHKAMQEIGSAVGDGIYKTVCPLCGAVREDMQIGLEETPEQYIQRLVEVFREVKRVLKDDGTLWVNIGDTYNTSSYHKTEESNGYGKQGTNRGSFENIVDRPTATCCKPKDLIGIPWKLAEALKSPYYTGVMKNELDRVWMASTIDAEGCITGSIHNRKDGSGVRKQLFINITNTSVSMLSNAKRIFQSSSITEHPNYSSHLGNRRVFRWSVGGMENKLLFIQEIYPYLVVKKKQAKVAYNFLLSQINSKSDGHTSRKEKSNKYREKLIGMICSLNKGEDVDVSSLEEPKSLYEPMFYLRQDIVWSKLNAMPEPVKDRFTKSHEYVFLFSKKPHYYFDHNASLEDAESEDHRMPGVARNRVYGYDSKVNNHPEAYLMGTNTHIKFGGKKYGDSDDTHYQTYSGNEYVYTGKRTKRDVWNISVSSYTGAHFATYPEELVLPCILCGTKEGDTVLDPFNGSGTTGIVALKNNRKYVGIDLSSEYIKLAEERFDKVFFDRQPVRENKEDERYERRFRGLDV